MFLEYIDNFETKIVKSDYINDTIEKTDEFNISYCYSAPRGFQNRGKTTFYLINNESMF